MTKTIAGGVHLERDRGQLWSEPVMQVALKTAALRRSGQDETVASLRQLLDEDGGMDSGAHLVEIPTSSASSPGDIAG